MEPRVEQKSRFKIEKLEERIAPAHLNPGVGTVVLTTAAAHGGHGLETSVEAPADHHRPIIILLSP